MSFEFNKFVVRVQTLHPADVFLNLNSTHNMKIDDMKTTTSWLSASLAHLISQPVLVPSAKRCALRPQYCTRYV